MIDFGLDAEQFASLYLDKQPYLRRAAFSKNAFHWREIDRVLPVIETDPAAFKLFRQGELAPHSYMEESTEFGRHTARVNKHRFYDLLQHGATLVINQMERYSLLARRLGMAISKFTGLSASSNTYISFGGAGTFGRHWDTHDVVILQLAGRKRWQVFEPSWPMPLSHQTSERMNLDCPSTPSLDITLETGDALYIPRGWWHNVTPLQEGSVHLSVGMYAFAIADYIAWLCATHLPNHLPAREQATAANLHSIPAVMELLARVGLEKQSLAEYDEEMLRRSRLISEFNTELFASGTSLALHGEARLTLLTTSSVDSVELRINGGRIRLDDLGQKIIATLTHKSWLTFNVLCKSLPQQRREDIAAAVLGLARHEVINIDASYGE